MNKFIGVIGIIIGIIINIYAFYFNSLYEMSIFFIFLIEILGLLISLLALLKFKEKIFSSIGIILNIIPFVYFLILIIAIG